DAPKIHEQSVEPRELEWARRVEVRVDLALYLFENRIAADRPELLEKVFANQKRDQVLCVRARVIGGFARLIDLPDPHDQQDDRHQCDGGRPPERLAKLLWNSKRAALLDRVGQLIVADLVEKAFETLLPTEQSL